MKIFKIKSVYAHCDLPCGVYNPDQAKIEAESILGICNKYDGLSDQDKTRAIIIKEQRAELVKQHLWILWTDYFKPEHLQNHPNLHDVFWSATKQAGTMKKSTKAQDARSLLDQIDEISNIFKETKNT